LAPDGAKCANNIDNESCMEWATLHHVATDCQAGCLCWYRFGTEHRGAAWLHEDQNWVVAGTLCWSSSCSSRPGMWHILHSET